MQPCIAVFYQNKVMREKQLQQHHCIESIVDVLPHQNAIWATSSRDLDLDNEQDNVFSEQSGSERNVTQGSAELGTDSPQAEKKNTKNKILEAEKPETENPFDWF